MHVRAVLFSLIALASHALAADAPCSAALTSAVPSIDRVPFALIARAAIPTFEAATGQARVETNKKTEHVVRDCRGHEAVADFSGAEKEREAGTIVDGGRAKLSDGRQAVWLMTSSSTGAPATSWGGFLALARLELGRVVIDAITAWDNGEDAKRVLRGHSLSGKVIWVEPYGHSGTGGGGDDAGERVFIERDGQLLAAGRYSTEGFDEFLGKDDPHWQLAWKARPRFLPGTIVLDEEVTWTLSGETERVVKGKLQHQYVLDGDKLVERPLVKRKAPPLPAPSAP